YLCPVRPLSSPPRRSSDLSFYAVASSGELADAISQDEDRRWRVSTLRAIRSESGAAPGNTEFIDALIRIREREGMYQTLPRAVTDRKSTRLNSSHVKISYA